MSYIYTEEIPKINVYSEESKTIENLVEEQLYCQILNIVQEIKTQIENKNFTNIYEWADKIIKTLKE